MTTILDTLDNYFFYLQHTRKVTHGTLLTYKLSLKEFCFLFGNKSTVELNATHIIRFKNWLESKQCERKKQKVSPWYVYSTMIRIKSYIKWLSERGYTKNLFPSDVPINKTILQSPTYLTKDELKLVFDMLDKQVEVVLTTDSKRDYIYAALQTRAIVHMLYATWLRNAELRSLKPSDIDMQNMRGIVYGKWGKYNHFTFNRQAKQMLNSFLDFKTKYYWNSQAHLAYVFVSANFGKPISAVWVNSALKFLWEKIGLWKKLHAHVFRHTCATMLLNNWANIREVQEKLRHVNLDTTALYTHITDNTLSQITRWLEII